MITARNVSTGSQVPVEADQYRQLITLSQGGALQTAAVAGRLFSICNQAKVETSAGIDTTWTGLGVANPAGSGRNFIIHRFGWGLQIAADDDGTIGLMTATPGNMAAALTAQNCLDGSSLASRALCDSDAETGTQVLRRIYGDYGTVATTTINTTGPHDVDLKGGLILPPNRAVLTYTTTTPTACFIFYFVWEEVPI